MLRKEWEKWFEKIESADSTEELALLKALWLGKQGELSHALKSLNALPPAERKTHGLALNLFKEKLTQALHHRLAVMEENRWKKELSHERVDITAPGVLETRGFFHPVMEGMNELITLLTQMGFSLRWGPDWETEFHNFDALNVPPYHPARTMQDTFYLPQGWLLRTQTTPVQIRTLLQEKPPLKVISVGRVYRADSDRTHVPMFHQIEGFMVDSHGTMAELKGCLETLLTLFLGQSCPLRFRPSFFPFTVPSAEVDVQLPNGTWLELLGCGMIHPRVLKTCHVDESIKGFAFGMGLERILMAKYGFQDMRELYQNDTRWLKHYGFPA